MLEICGFPGAIFFLTSLGLVVNKFYLRSHKASCENIQTQIFRKMSQNAQNDTEYANLSQNVTFSDYRVFSIKHLVTHSKHIHSENVTKYTEKLTNCNTNWS